MFTIKLKKSSIALLPGIPADSPHLPFAGPGVLHSFSYLNCESSLIELLSGAAAITQLS